MQMHVFDFAGSAMNMVIVCHCHCLGFRGRRQAHTLCCTQVMSKTMDVLKNFMEVPITGECTKLEELVWLVECQPGKGL